MKLPEFLLDEWLGQKLSGPHIDFDLGSSTGPVWKLRELLALAPDGEMARLLEADLFYTEAAGSPDLRQAVAELEGTSSDRIQMVTGGAEALLLLFTAAATETNGNVIVPQPGFPTNFALPEWLGIEVRHYQLRRENQFRVDPDEIQALVDQRTRFVLVNSPHNPTGAVLSDAELEQLHDFCAERGVQLVVDQVYHPIYHGPATRSAARLPHATVLGDFSKALCLSGLRTGWLVEPNAARRQEYKKARSYFTVSNPVLSERLALLALKNREAIYDRARRVTAANLALLEPVMESCLETVGWVRPRGGMTALAWRQDGGDGRELAKRLLADGILVAPGDCFGMPEYFRIGFGTSGERFGAAMDRFVKVLTWPPAVRAASSPTRA